MTISAGTFTFVADLVRRRSAIELMAGKEYLVEGRLMLLVRQAGLAGVDEYVETLRSGVDRAEQDLVVDAMTTTETSWFRDFLPFQTLAAHVVPGLVRDRSALTSICAWSAGCSTGQEPYSIAMALLDATPGLDIKITATDICREVLTRARAGRYSQLEIGRGLPSAMLLRHFTRAGTEWQLSEEVRSKVTFSQRNLLDPAPAGGPFDIIFLRNVLIYFDVETRRDVLRRVRSVLAPGGYLILGAAESTLGVEDLWDQVSVGHCLVYQVRAGEAA